MPKKRRGRPATDNPKNLRVDVRLTPEELELLDGYCQERACHAHRACGMESKPFMQTKNKESGARWRTYYTAFPTATCEAAA